MHRYTSLFLLTFLLLVVVLTGNTYLAGYADNNSDRNMKSITIYTTLPTEHVAILAREYEKNNKIKVDFVQMSEKDLVQKFEEQQFAKKADAVLASKEVLSKLAHSSTFTGYASEHTDMIAKKFKDEDSKWIGVWYDPIVFCANRDYLKTLPKIPATWNELAHMPNVRLGLTDFLAADAAANLLYTLVAEYDEQTTFNLLQLMHPKVVQYSKYLASPVRMAGMGEVDIAIAVQSETIRYSNDGFPISIIYPREGTAYMLTGVGVVKGSKNKEEVKQFIDWLLQDDVQLCLQKNKFFFVPTNQSTFAYKAFTGKNLVLFENYSDLTSSQKHTVIDRWVKEIRLK